MILASVMRSARPGDVFSIENTTRRLNTWTVHFVARILRLFHRLAQLRYQVAGILAFGAELFDQAGLPVVGEIE